MQRASAIIALGLLIRLMLAGYTAYLGPDLGLIGDVRNFYDEMIFVAHTGSFAAWEIGPAPVINFIGTIMGLFGDSVLVACVTACIAWGFAGILLTATAGELGADSRQLSLLASLYAFWPSSIPLTAIPLREPFQMLFISFATYGVTVAMLRGRLIGWLMGASGALLAGTLHGALAAFAIIFGAITLTMSAMIGGKSLPIGRLIISAIVALPLIYFGYNLLLSTTYDFSSGAIDAIQNYQTGGLSEVSRAEYKSRIDVGTGFSQIIFIIYGFFQYLLEPLPQRISQVRDLFLAFENFARLIILLISLFSLRKKMPRDNVIIFGTLISCYISMELIWSVGTTNWGTAARHHLPALGFLLLSIVKANLFARSRPRESLILSEPIPPPRIASGR